MAGLPFAYRLWIRSVERKHAEAIVEEWPWKPQFAVVLHGQTGTPEDLVRRSTRSTERQRYHGWTLIDGIGRPIGAAIRHAKADYVVPLRAGDELAQAALVRFAEAAQSSPRPSILYGDQDQRDATGRRARPWFKPRWNREMFLAHDFLSGAVAIAHELASQSATETDDLDSLLLTATDGEVMITHVPHILAHVAERPAELLAARVQAVSRHLERRDASCAVGPFGTIKVQWALPDRLPLVSIIVPTRDQPELLRACLDSVLTRTSYAPFEIIVVDNGSVEPATMVYLEEVSADPRVRVLRYDLPYNYSAINNFAVQQTNGSYLCLLNNDTEVIEPEWLSEMMRYAVRPDVGAVGAKLLYDDLTIQHAGVVIGIGDAAGHAHRFVPESEPGYFKQPHVAQFVSAVTAACLVVERAKFEKVGGLDEKHLPVAFNDVDLCLKLQEVGWRNVYVPHAVLLHHESKSRGSDLSPANRDRFRRELAVLQERWGTRGYEDPLHNPNLDRSSETYVLRI